MRDTKYYLAKPGTKDVQGPMTVDEIRAALHAGSMTYDYVYCAVGMKEWKPVVSLPGLVPEMSAAVPGAPGAFFCHIAKKNLRMVLCGALI